LSLFGSSAAITSFFNERTRRHTTVPYHNRDLAPGTVAAIVRQAGLTGDEFIELL